MLYRQTTSTDEDFDPSGFPEAFDDNDLGDNSIVARAETSSPKQIQFFIEVRLPARCSHSAMLTPSLSTPSQVVKLFAIKCRILRSLYDLQNPKNFPREFCRPFSLAFFDSSSRVADVSSLLASDAHDVLVLEEQLLLWHQGVPDFLKDPSKTPADGPYKLQAHVLLNR